MSAQSAFDPTKNVLDLVHADADRQDAILDIHIKRIDDLREAETRRINDINELRAYYENKLQEAQTKLVETLVARQSQSTIQLAEQQGAENISTPLIITIAAIAGGLVSFLFQNVF